MKAVFVDYTGTIVQERGPEIEQVILRIYQNSQLPTPKDALALWWTRLRQYEEQSCGDAYQTEDQLVDQILTDFEREYGLQDDFAELHALIQAFWSSAPLFPDAREFFERCPVPIYIITNNGRAYVEKALAHHQLAPAGIITADMVRFYKPHKEIFEKTLSVSGCAAEEVLHIGDSYTSDVLGARAAGIRALLVQRKEGGAYPNECVVRSLPETLAHI